MGVTYTPRLVFNAPVTVPDIPLPDDVAIYQAMHLQEQQIKGSGGGSVTADVWADRILNTTVDNDIDGASLANLTGIITLNTPGLYELIADTTAFSVSGHRARWYDVTNGVPFTNLGMNNYVTNAAMTHARAILRLNLTAPRQVKLQQRCTGNFATYGHGLPMAMDFDNEVYAEVLIRRFK